eukprot:14138283-Ditylum_brightwellii.AAC.1
MNIEVKNECAKLGRQSEDTKQCVDEEVLVPLIRAVASEVLNDFQKQLGEALHDVQTILQEHQNWKRWFTAAKAKGASHMKDKTKECVEEKKSWPGSEYLGDCLCAMILEKAFDIKKDNGHLKNNFATAGYMPMPAEIQVHHEEILELKESKMHLLYEISWAKSIDSLQGSAQANNGSKINKKALEEKD